MDEDYIYTALSEQGIKVYDRDNIGRGAIYHIDSEEMGDGLSNAVAVDDNHVYVANGLSGLYIGNKPNRNNFEMSGALNVSGSANFIAAKNDFIIVANGISGTKILKRKASEATIDLEDRDIIYQSFDLRNDGEYRGGNYGEKDADDLEDPSNRKKNQIQIPINDLESLTEVSFEYESDEDYIFKVYLGYDEGQYDEQILEVESKKNKGWKEASLELDKSGYNFLILSAIPTNKKKGRAYFKNIEIKGIK